MFRVKSLSYAVAAATVAGAMSVSGFAFAEKNPSLEEVFHLNSSQNFQPSFRLKMECYRPRIFYEFDSIKILNRDFLLFGSKWKIHENVETNTLKKQIGLKL